MIRFIRIAIALLMAQSAWAEPITLQTPQGKLLGETSGPVSEVRVFKGMPFAIPPVGDRRWKPAQPAPSFKSVRLATRFGPSCAQPGYPEGSFFSSPSAPTSEDCLYLNVWSAAQENEQLPVMVWIHGGGLTRGSGASSAYDGTELARKGVVVVTINYRLGIFGYFTHPELSKESPHNSSGNYGTSDQVMALKWVQENISAFGGDPNNVTIFGESAGSFSVHHMMSTPLAAGLFHRAIGESGTSFRPMLALRKGDITAEGNGLKFASSVKAKSLAELRKMTAREILDASQTQRFRPVLDGWVFPDQIYDLFKDGKYNAVPLMVGFNAEEGTTLGVLSRLPKDQESYINSARERYGELADEFLTLYPASDLRRSTLNAFRDGFASWGMQTWAMMMANTSTDAYVYYFSHWPAGEELGAYHAAEIVYVFNNVTRLRSDAPAGDVKLADLMSDYWVAFAKQGRPKVKGLPKWKPYKAKSRRFMEFKDGKALAGKDLLPGVWEFHDKVNGLQR